MTKAATYTVRYAYDVESGAWTGELVEIPQVHTYGRSIQQFRNRIREALWAWTGNKRHAERAEPRFEMLIVAEQVRTNTC